jgi:uncharacterized membrane protein
MDLIEIWIVPLGAGLLLSAATGLRAFLPLCLVSWSVRLGWFEPHAALVWIGSTPALVAFTAAVVIEILADKFPAVDSFVDSVQTVIKPVIAIAVMAVPLVELDPLYAAVVGLLAGAPIATAVHLVKAHGRLLANLLSFGLAAPILSFLEDALTILIVILAIVLPLLGLLLALIVVIWYLRRKPATLVPHLYE